MIRLRMIAMACGAVPVRSVEASSPKVTSRTQWGAVLAAPVLSGVAGQLLGAGGCGQAGDAVRDFFAGALAVQAADIAADAEHLGGVWEVDAIAGCDRRGAGGALFGAPVSAVALDVLGREVAGRAAPGVAAGGEQLGLVGLDGEHVVRALRDEPAGGGPLVG